RFFEEPSQRVGTSSWTLASPAPKEQALETLRQAGFKDLGGALDRLHAWQKGSHCPKGDERSRAAIVELIPGVIEAAGRTGDPDKTLEHLDVFLAKLDKGLRCFSLLSANPQVLDLLVDITAAAPALANVLSRAPDQLQSALSADFFSLLPDGRLFAAEIADLMRQGDLKLATNRAAAWASARRFQIAVNILRHRIDSSDAGQALRGVADAIVRGTAARLTDELASGGGPPARETTVVAFGAYGTGDLTTRSPMDLLFLHERGEAVTTSDPGPAQRLVALLSTPTENGQLCDLNGDAGPWGEVGPLVAQLDTFQSLNERLSGLRPLLALSQARVIMGPRAERVAEVVRGLIATQHDMSRLAAAAVDLRREAVAAGATDAIVDPRRCPGGLEDLELTVRMYQWRHAVDMPAILEPSVPRALANLGSLGLIPEPLVKRLLGAHRLLRQLECVLGVAVEEPLGRDRLPEGLASLLLRAGGAGNFQQLDEAVEDATSTVRAAFGAVVDRAGDN
ncbi:MAG: [glutamine synthetase] adenylyltransferase / [glutamine synthetase]-adenylyl-L-tyrosine, partial [Rhodospirillaceae bacterium]|nr:[glutamine synthetase] adenylyltransferase / [glutamine synthetase]-adenylyl-L-tyrosine [Rhodospirillaceae bacterium]